VWFVSGFADGFEHHRLVARIDSHSGGVMSVAFSPNGRWLFMGGDHGAARVLDAASRAELAKLEGHSDVVMSAAFSPDGLQVVTASRDSTARVWDAAGRRGLGKLEGHKGAMWCASCSPDGRWVSFLRPVDGALNLFVTPADSPNAARPLTRRAGRGLQAFDVSGVPLARWTPDSRRILFPVDRDGDEKWNLHVVDVASGDERTLTDMPDIAVDFQRFVTQSPDRETFDNAALTFPAALELPEACYGWG